MGSQGAISYKQKDVPQATPGTSTNTTTAPQAAPTLKATPIDVTPEKGFFEAMWSKVVDIYSSTFKADERIDRMQQMPRHQAEIGEAIYQWRGYANSVDPAVRVHVDALSGAIGQMVRKSGDTFSEAMNKLNDKFMEITGYVAADLTPERRRDLSVDQRAKLTRAYEEMKQELQSSKTPYTETANAVNEIGAALNELMSLDAQQKEPLKPFEVAVKDSSVQAIAPDFDTKVEAIYASARQKAFAEMAQSDGVQNGSVFGVKAAIAFAKAALEGAGKFVNDVVTHAMETADHFKKNEAIRNDILSGVRPADASKKVAYVSQNTLDGLKAWFDDKSTAAEATVNGAFAAANSQEEIEKWVDTSKQFGITSEQYRGTLGAVGNALTPFTPLVDATKGSSDLFATTVEDVKKQVEEAALHFVTKLPHDKAMEKLEKLAGISAKIAEKAEEDLKSGGGLTQDEADNIRRVLSEKLTELTKATTKSWI